MSRALHRDSVRRRLRQVLQDVRILPPEDQAQVVLEAGDHMRELLWLMVDDLQAPVECPVCSASIDDVLGIQWSNDPPSLWVKYTDPVQAAGPPPPPPPPPHLDWRPEEPPRPPWRRGSRSRSRSRDSRPPLKRHWVPPPNPAGSSSRTRVIRCWGKQLQQSNATLSLLTDSDTADVAPSTPKPKPKRMPQARVRLPTQPDYPPPDALQATAGHDAGGLQCEGDRGGGGRGGERGGGGNSVVMTPVKIEHCDEREVQARAARRDGACLLACKAELNKRASRQKEEPRQKVKREVKREPACL